MLQIIGLITAFLMVSGSLVSSGQTDDISYIKKRLARCASVTGDLARLECYDQLARELGLIAKTTALPTQGTGKWNVSTKTNPIDDSRTVVLVLEADEGLSRSGDKILLIIRCMKKQTELYINWNDYLGLEETHVLTRVGTAPAITKTWSISTDSKGSFYPGSPIPFIRSLMNADKLLAQVTPYNENPVTAVFDIRGLAQAIKPLQEICGWK